MAVHEGSIILIAAQLAHSPSLMVRLRSAAGICHLVGKRGGGFPLFFLYFIYLPGDVVRDLDGLLALAVLHTEHRGRVRKLSPNHTPHIAAVGPASLHGTPQRS
jgi:hypothetical protein